MSNEQEAMKLQLQMEDKIKELLEERGVKEEEIKMVIHNAETTGEKLYQPDTNKYLAKREIGEATFYVEYGGEGGKYEA
jgi:hypothetical protein